MSATDMSTEKTQPIEIVIASSNPGKVSELKNLLGDHFSVTTADVHGANLPEETGATFAENARLKARSVFEQTGKISIADDSGLEVASLNGSPGVHTARFAGPMATDEDNRKKLLRELEGKGHDQRLARFVSAIAIAFSASDIVTTEGICEGVIAPSERGEGGFGYDSIFQLPSGKTMAEIDAGEKNRISHRGLAMRKASEVLEGRIREDQGAQK